MKFNWTYFLSLRYMFTHNGRKGHLGNTLAILGLSLGITALITVLTVMNGFQQGFINSINEIYSYHIRVDLNESDNIQIEHKEIRAQVRFRDQQGILTSKESLSSGAQIRFIDFAAIQNDSAFLNELNLVDGAFPAETDEMLMGRDMARYLALTVGDEISLSYLSFGSSSFNSRNYRITGIFKSSYYEYDRNLAFVPLDEGSAPAEIIGIKLNRHFRDRKILNDLKASFPDLKVESWRDYNSAFYNALKIEKIFMFLIMGLIFIVVAVNIYHSMKRNVKERILELALLKAIGAKGNSILKIYLNQGYFIAGISILLGSSCGIALSLNINEIIDFFISFRLSLYDLIIRIPGPLSELPHPGQFYFTHIPIYFLWKDLIIINISATAAVLYASWASVKQASKILPAEIFRNE